MKVAFICDYLNLRGMAVAPYDYAHYNETLLNNESFIFYDNNYPHIPTLKKFTDRFKNVIPYDCYIEVGPLLEHYKIDFVHRLSFGHDESYILENKTCPWGIHTVFKYNCPYGDVYTYISEWLRNECNPNLDFVPHMINLPNENGTLHDELGLNKHDIIIGCYGGSNSFDLKIAKRAIIQAAKLRNNIHFIFMNIDKFTIDPRWRCTFLPGTYDLVRKTKFINTCDAMIHGRQRGETFGLAVGEFSSRNKRIITWNGAKERAHINILGNKGILYNKVEDLTQILTNIQKDTQNNYDCFSKQFSPEKVMEKFSKVFLGK